MSTPLRVFIGYDTSEDVAYRVARDSLLAHASVPVQVEPLVIEELNARGLYTRPFWRDSDGQRYDCIDGKPFSTDFSFTRFLVPALCEYEGLALFIDSDVMFRADVAELFRLCQGQRAVWCVQHDFEPPPSYKMRTGLRQEPYRRKAWSAVMVFNCAHTNTKALTPWAVNHLFGIRLHAMDWAGESIGALPEEWHWLEGHSSISMEAPKLVHFTRGTPDIPAYSSVPFADEWLDWYGRQEAAD